MASRPPGASRSAICRSTAIGSQTCSSVSNAVTYLEAAAEIGGVERAVMDDRGRAPADPAGVGIRGRQFEPAWLDAVGLGDGAEIAHLAADVEQVIAGAGRAQFPQPPPVPLELRHPQLPDVLVRHLEVGRLLVERLAFVDARQVGVGDVAVDVQRPAVGAPREAILAVRHHRLAVAVFDGLGRDNRIVAAAADVTAARSEGRRHARLR